MDDRARRFAKCEAMGEVEVRAKLASGIIANRNADYAREWLALIEAADDLPARSVVAAEAQARYARRANWISVAALAVALIALIVAAIPFLQQL